MRQFLQFVILRHYVGFICSLFSERTGFASVNGVNNTMAQGPELLRCLLRAKDCMDATSQEEWPVERLVRISNVSEAHFARSFKEAFGVPPLRYLLTRRIERAKALLRDSVPGCYLSAANRPDLTIAVLEKRRLEAGVSIASSNESEVP